VEAQVSTAAGLLGSQCRTSPTESYPAGNAQNSTPCFPIQNLPFNTNIPFDFFIV
jgi:hypothetical protein